MNLPSIKTMIFGILIVLIGGIIIIDPSSGNELGLLIIAIGLLIGIIGLLKD